MYKRSWTVQKVVEWLNQDSFSIHVHVSAPHIQSPGTLLFWLEDLISFRSMFSIDILVISPSLSLSSPEGRGSAMFLLISPRDRQALDTRVTFSSVAVLMMFTTGEISMNIIMISSYPSPLPPSKIIFLLISDPYYSPSCLMESTTTVRTAELSPSLFPLK